MLKWVTLILLLPGILQAADVTTTKFNPFSGRLDFILKSSSLSVGALLDISTASASEDDVLTYNAVTGVWGAEASGGSGGSETGFRSIFSTNAVTNTNGVDTSHAFIISTGTLQNGTTIYVSSATINNGLRVVGNATFGDSKSNIGLVEIGQWVNNPTAGALYLNSRFSTGTAYNFVSPRASPNLSINRPNGYGIFFLEDNTFTQMRILTGGNVSIGNANPSSKFDLIGGSITVRGTDAGIYLAGISSISAPVFDVRGSTIQTRSYNLVFTSAPSVGDKMGVVQVNGNNVVLAGVGDAVGAGGGGSIVGFRSIFSTNAVTNSDGGDTVHPFIISTGTLQKGTTLYVSSATVQDNLTVHGNRIELGPNNSYWDNGVAIADSNIIAFDAFDYMEYDKADNAFRFHIGAAPNPQVEITEGLLRNHSEVTGASRGVSHSQHNDGTEGSRFRMRKSRGTLASPTTVVTGDNIGRIVADAHDGTGYLEMGAIEIQAAGTIDTNRVPTEINFYTATDAAPSVLTQRMTLNPAGNLGIGTNNPSSKLDVFNGSITVRGTNSGLRLENALDIHSGGTKLSTNPLVSYSFPAGSWKGINPKKANEDDSNVSVTSNTLRYNIAPWDYFEFKDSTRTFVGVQFTMPKGYDGSTVAFAFDWYAGSGTNNNNCRFCMDGVVISSGTTMSTVVGSSVCVTSTFKAANQNTRSIMSPSLTLGGSPLGERTVFLRFYRNKPDGRDTLNSFVYMTNVDFFYKRNNYSDE